MFLKGIIITQPNEKDQAKQREPLGLKLLPHTKR
jgi:hypothetical protein